MIKGGKLQGISPSRSMCVVDVMLRESYLQVDCYANSRILFPLNFIIIFKVYQSQRLFYRNHIKNRSLLQSFLQAACD
jgi:hypothetical protein